MKLALYITVILLTALNVSGQSDPHELMRLAIVNASTVKSAAYIIENTERIDGELLKGTQEVRYQQEPLQIYMTFIAPDRGAMVIFDETVRPDKLTYDPAGFPFMNLDLDPLGATARNSNHHTIYETGFAHLAKLMRLVYASHDEIEMSVDNELEGDYSLSLKSKNLGTSQYTVGLNESTRSIAHRLEICEYKIVELNNQIKSYGELKEGLTITVPNTYAHELSLKIDKTSLLPVKLTLKDELGLLASYTINNIELNVSVISPSMKKSKHFGADQ